MPVDDTVVADDEAKTLMMDDKTTVADLLAAIGDSEGKLYSVTDSKGSKLSADALVGTGAVVTELVSGAAEKYTAIVRGDVNGDGKLTATDEVCEHCGAPMVIVTTTRGPWKLCPNFSCPGKEIEAEKKAAAKEAKAAAKKAPAKKTAAKKPAAKKTTAKKAAAAKEEQPAE